VSVKKVGLVGGEQLVGYF